MGKKKKNDWCRIRHAEVWETKHRENFLEMGPLAETQEREQVGLGERHGGGLEQNPKSSSGIKKRIRSSTQKEVEEEPL